jgi:hypothetical protein
MVKLFIDDEREPPDETWVVVRTFAQAIDHVEDHGVPESMSLDHDLGGDETVMQFLRWLCDHHFEKGPPRYVVHSANPVGRDNMISFLESWKRAVREDPSAPRSPLDCGLFDDIDPNAHPIEASIQAVCRFIWALLPHALCRCTNGWQYPRCEGCDG